MLKFLFFLVLAGLTLSSGEVDIYSAENRASVMMPLLHQLTAYTNYLEAYANKYDYDRIRDLFTFAAEVGLCNSDSIIFDGGANEGLMLDTFMEGCKDAEYYGFEIQPDYSAFLTMKYDSFPNVHILNVGWSNVAAVDLEIGGRGVMAGLFDVKGSKFEEWGMNEHKGATVPMSEFCELKEIDKVLYTLIDVEGHECAVFEGMRLEDPVNRKRFPIIQYELGPAWTDFRNGLRDRCTEYSTAKRLSLLGYDLYIIHRDGYLMVSPDFFLGAEVYKNTFELNDPNAPLHVEGNALAVHSEYADKRLAGYILRKAAKITSEYAPIAEKIHDMPFMTAAKSFKYPFIPTLDEYLLA